VQQLGDDEVGDLVFDRGAEEDDALVEQAREDVELALAAGGALDHHRDQLRMRVHGPHPIDRGRRARASVTDSAYPAWRCR